MCNGQIILDSPCGPDVILESLMKGAGGVESESEDIRIEAEVREERKCYIGYSEDEGAMS